MSSADDVRAKRLAKLASSANTTPNRQQSPTADTSTTNVATTVATNDNNTKVKNNTKHT